MTQEVLPLLKNMEAICPISTLSTMSKWSIFAARSVTSDDKTNNDLENLILGNTAKHYIDKDNTMQTALTDRKNGPCLDGF